MSKGGARHTAKPEVDEGLLVSLFSEQRSSLQHVGSYERISRSQACNPKGLIDLLPLTKGLVKLEPTCEIHTQCLRKALFQVWVESGKTWSLAVPHEKVGKLLFAIMCCKIDSAATARGCEYDCKEGTASRCPKG